MNECPICGRCLEDAAALCPDDGAPLDRTLAGSPLIDGKYRLERRLGAGGMGSVYKASHIELRKAFAVKLMKTSFLSDPAMLGRFRVEAMALGKLRHPHIVQVTDYGIDPRTDGLPYLVMEFLEGMSLSRAIKKRGSFSPDEALPILRSIAAALDHAHESGILHRDLNPNNVFLVEDHGTVQVKILDFGLAKIAGENPVPGRERAASDRTGAPSASGDTRPFPQGEEDATRTLNWIDGAAARRLAKEGEEIQGLTAAGSTMGTPGYIAPEIWRGEAPTRYSDIYSFGVLAHEILTGRKPFIAGSSFSADHSQPRGTAVSPSSGIPGEAEAAILCALAADPALRPAAAKELVRRLDRGYADLRYRTWRKRERPRRAAMAAGLSLFFLVTALAIERFSIFRNLENVFVDARFRMSALHAPDPRIVLVSIDDAALRADPKPLADKAGDMGALLQRIMDDRPRGIAVDFLLPERWNESEEFAKFVLRNWERLIIAEYIKADGSLMGWEFLKGLIMAALGSNERARELFGFINLAPDGDGRIRRAIMGMKNSDGFRIDSMAARAYYLLTGGNPPLPARSEPLWIDAAVDWSRYAKISWTDLGDVLRDKPGIFKDKFVFVGGEYEGSQDFHSIPRFSGDVSGLTIQALILDTLLRGAPIRGTNIFLVGLILSVPLFFVSWALLMKAGAIPAVLQLAALGAVYTAFAFLIFIKAGLVFPVSPLLFSLAFSVIPGLWKRRRLTYIAKEVDSP
jgi:serine/threonine protein kinase